MDVCYCVVKKLEPSSEYFGRYCKKKIVEAAQPMAELKKKLKMYS